MKEMKGRDGKTYAYSIGDKVMVGNEFPGTMGLGIKENESDIGLVAGYGRVWVSIEDAIELRDALTKCIETPYKFNSKK